MRTSMVLSSTALSPDSVALGSTPFSCSLPSSYVTRPANSSSTTHPPPDSVVLPGNNGCAGSLPYTEMMSLPELPAPALVPLVPQPANSITAESAAANAAP